MILQLQHCERTFGKLDAHLIAKVCQFYNQKDGLELVPVFLSDLKKESVFPLIKTMSSLKMKERVSTKITTSTYNTYINIFSDPSITQTTLVNTMRQLKELVKESVFVQCKENLVLLEKLFIALLGNEQEFIRNCSIQYLNAIYDKVDWVFKGGYLQPKIQTVGEAF